MCHSKLLKFSFPLCLAKRHSVGVADIIRWQPAGFYFKPKPLRCKPTAAVKKSRASLSHTPVAPYRLSLLNSLLWKYTEPLCRQRIEGKWPWKSNWDYELVLRVLWLGKHTWDAKLRSIKWTIPSAKQHLKTQLETDASYFKDLKCALVIVFRKSSSQWLCSGQRWHSFSTGRLLSTCFCVSPSCQQNGAAIRKSWLRGHDFKPLFEAHFHRFSFIFRPVERFRFLILLNLG